MSTIEVVIIDAPPDVVDDSFTVATNEDWFRGYQITKDGEAVAIEAGWKIYLQAQGSTGLLSVNASTDNRRIVVTDLATGKFAFQIRASESYQIAPDSYKYDIVLVAGDAIYRLARGVITVEKGITIVPGQEKWTHFPLIARP